MAREEETGGKRVGDVGCQVRGEELPVDIEDYWEEEKIESGGWREMRGCEKERDKLVRTRPDGPAEGGGDAGAVCNVEGAGTRGWGA